MFNGSMRLNNLSPISGEFVNAQREEAFRSERLPETVRHARLLFLISAILNTLFLASDWRFYGHDHFWVAVPARLAVVGVSLMCWWLLRNAVVFRAAETIMVLWQWVTGIGVAFLVSSRSDLALFVVLMLPSIFYLVVPTSFRWSTVSGLGCSVLLLGGYLLPAPLESTAPGLVLAVLTLNVALYLVVARSNRLRRLEWAAMQAERRTARELRAAVAAAEQASEAKTQFLASMSHEIRTPLHGIIGLTGLILARKDLDPEIRRQIQLIEVSGSSLLTVVNDVLDFSKIEAGAIEIDPMPFWPKAMISECASIVAELAARKNLVIEIDTSRLLPNRVLGDEPRLKQILLNLLNNAIKFTPAGTIAVSLRHESISETHERLRFSVSDTGIGIPHDKLHHLFERFSQVDGSTSRQFGGTGLGLAISKQLVELMGGRIGVESEPGCGSTFWFEVALPRVSDAPSRDRGSAAISNGGDRMHVLLAEDVAINQEIARAVIEAAGHGVDIVADGAEAVMAVQAKRYDLVLMDVQMPVMDGVQATRVIRALAPPACNVPIVAMTANVYAEQIALFKEAGMNDHIGKPFRREELAAVLERWSPAELRSSAQVTKDQQVTKGHDEAVRRAR
jgi:signal transduction histidine kinase/FixJ family two-component response regulator